MLGTLLFAAGFAGLLLAVPFGQEAAAPAAPAPREAPVATFTLAALSTNTGGIEVVGPDEAPSAVVAEDSASPVGGDLAADETQAADVAFEEEEWDDTTTGEDDEE